MTATNCGLGHDPERISCEATAELLQARRAAAQRWTVRLEAQEDEPHACPWHCFCRAWIVRLDGRWVAGYSPGRVHPGGQDGWRRALDRATDLGAPERAR